jgi:hypothetical protein
VLGQAIRQQPPQIYGQQSRGGLASVRTTNFVVQAQGKDVAELVGQWAEQYRRQKAVLWLGQEMPPWPQPCPLFVNVTGEGPSGATSFAFAPQGGVLDTKMEIQGPLDRLIASVLPHEITHTVFANYFRRPLPRWADEGGCVLMEDDAELDRHDKMTRGILNRNAQFRLRQLFTMQDYPKNGEKLACMYAQGFSVAHYLSVIGDQKAWLNFVALGMQGDWDRAAQTCYGMNRVEDLEEAWLKHLRDTKGTPITRIANCFNLLPRSPAAKAPAAATPTVITPGITVRPPAADPFAKANAADPLAKINSDLAGLAANHGALAGEIAGLKSKLGADLPSLQGKLDKLTTDLPGLVAAAAPAAAATAATLPNWLIPLISAIGVLALPGPVGKIVSVALGAGKILVGAKNKAIIPNASPFPPGGGTIAPAPQTHAPAVIASAATQAQPAAGQTVVVQTPPQTHQTLVPVPTADPIRAAYQKAGQLMANNQPGLTPLFNQLENGVDQILSGWSRAAA